MVDNWEQIADGIRGDIQAMVPAHEPGQRVIDAKLSCEQVGSETGLWCDVCVLPSKLSTVLLILVAGSPMSTASILWCSECGAAELSGS